MIVTAWTEEIDLSRRWKELVSLGKIQTVCIVKRGDKEVCVRYGLEIDVNGEDEETIVPFSVEHHSNQPLDFIEFPICRESYLETPDTPIIVRSLLNYRFFYTSTDISIVTVPSGVPQQLTQREHNETTCSLCTGPFTLLQREPLVSFSCLESHRNWQFHWNIAPQDYKGHFLIVPNIKEFQNRRAQFLTVSDLEDIIDIVGHAQWESRGRGFIGYNSIGAGASQNHIHFHGYMSPSPLFSFEFAHEERFYAIGETSFYIRSGFHYSGCNCSCIHVKSNKLSALLIFRLIEIIIQFSHPFNLLIGPDSLFIFVRSYNEAQVHPYMGLGVLEYSGVFVYHSTKELERYSVPYLCECMSSALINQITLRSIVEMFKSNQTRL